MEKRRLVDESFLATHPAKRWVHDRIVELLSSEISVPSFSTAAMKITAMAQDNTVGLDEMASVVALDPGLSERCLRVASSAAHGGHPFSTLQDALLLIGVEEMRRIAFTVGVMDNFNHLRVKVNWRQFWLHSVLVARMTERLAGAFREVSGTEYLTGLLHDIGKLILEHYFPREFEAVLLRSLERHCGHAQAEFDLLGLDHTCIGAALCQCLNLEKQIVHAVRFHHSATHPAHTCDPAGDAGFLACCVSVADTLANLGDISIGGHIRLAQSLEQQPEWLYLTEFFACRGLEMDLNEEIEKAAADITALV
jgi:putative nucleotidyltransferase with HDIG domain